MNKPNRDLRATWVGCLLFATALAAGCTGAGRVSEKPEVSDNSDALSQPDFECERSKRECLTMADCDADKRDACESAFRSCEEPVRAARDELREMCRTEREKCEAAATDELGKRACHTAERKCTLPVDPPEAVCHIDAEACLAAARPAGATPPAPMSDAEKACHDKEHACTDSMRLDPKDLPEPPHCEPPPPPDCMPAPPPPADPRTPPPAAAPGAPAPDHDACERTKRECLVAADCDNDKREACESAFRSCEAPIRAERDELREMCRTEREKCEAAATDETGKHACHIAEHKCTLPVEPAEAVCHIDAEECLWAARPADMTPPPPADPKTPPAPPPADPKTPPAPPAAMPPAAMPPAAMMPPPRPHVESDAEHACHEKEHECVEAMRMQPEDLPEPPHCPPPPPPACKPAPKKP